MVERGPIRYADSGGVEIAYQVVGSGPVDLVYVPGSANHIEAMWDIPELSRFTERLAAFSRLILLDKRGTGLSGRMPEGSGASVEDRTDDIRAVLDAVGSSSAWLFGTADGAPVAIVAAASHPDRVRGLVLYGASARLRWDDDYEVGLPDEVADLIIEAIGSVWGNEDDPGLTFVAPSVANDPRWRAGMARILRRSGTPADAIRYWTVNLDVDVRAALPAVAVPTLVIHTSGDQLYPAPQGRYVSDNIPGARFVELEGTDHFFFAEQGDRVADEIEEFVVGHLSETVADRRLATVLFTDIVGSTERSSELGDRAWRALLEAHDATVRALVDRHGGRLVKTLGDGCLAAFDGPRRGVVAAEAIIAASATLGLDVRAGLHSGEVEVLQTGDIAGIAVHIASRVASAASPGQILVTRTVRDLVIGSELAFTDQGEHRLKGVDEPWLLYARAPAGRRV